MSLTSQRILREIELLDWTGHVELPFADMQWLAANLYVKLSQSTEEVCDACNKPAPFVLTMALGNICAECVEDMNDNIDQMRDALGDE
jgi:predicted amidophosphoribosyltransferase